MPTRLELFDEEKIEEREGRRAGYAKREGGGEGKEKGVGEKVGEKEARSAKKEAGYFLIILEVDMTTVYRAYLKTSLTPTAQSARTITQNTLIQTITTLHQSYIVRFDVYPSSYRRDLSNIVMQYLLFGSIPVLQLPRSHELQSDVSLLLLCDSFHIVT